MTISSADHHCAKRIASLWTQAHRSLAKIANYLHAARGQLPSEDFAAIAAELPFPRECVDHFLTVGKSSQQNPMAFSQAVTIGLHAVARMIDTPGDVAPTPIKQRSRRQLSVSLAVEQVDYLASLSPEDRKAAVNMGIRALQAAKAAEAAPPVAAELLQAAE